MDAQANNYYDQSEEDVIGSEMRKGPWTVEEDSLLTQYVSVHGEGRWNSAARCAGLKRTGKSCRLRWLNYLRPEVRRGNITLQEQLLILELHSRWGNRWSKIAQRLPGRTDNEIKNYWRTRVQKQAKQLKCDVNSKQFRDAMRHVWIPRLIERIQASSPESSSSMGQPATTIPTTTTTTTTTTTAYQSSCYMGTNQMDVLTSQPGQSNEYGSEWSDPNFLPELSDSLDTQVSPASDLTTTATADGPNPYPSGYYPDCGQNGSSGVYSGSDSGSWGWYNPGQEWNESLGMDSLEQMWNDESLLFLRQQLL